MSQGLRIYLSAPDAIGLLVAEAARELTEAGHEVTSTWHHDGRGDRLGSMELVPLLLADIQAVVASDIIIGWTMGGDRSRSMFELGAATHAGLHVHLVGHPDQQSYDLLPTVTRWQTWVHFRRGAQLGLVQPVARPPFP